MQLALLLVYARCAYPTARPATKQTSAASKRTARRTNRDRDRADSLSGAGGQQPQASRSHSPVTSRDGRDGEHLGVERATATAAEPELELEGEGADRDELEPPQHEPSSQRGNANDNEDNQPAANARVALDMRAAAADCDGGENNAQQHSPHVQRSASPSRSISHASPRSRAGAGAAGEDLDAALETEEQRRWKRLAARVHSVSALGDSQLPPLV